MNPSEYLDRDAVGLADLIARREVSASEVLDAAMTRLALVNPKINAVILTMEAEARETAGRARQGPLGGVPFLIKDLGVGVRGWPTSAGSRLFQGAVAERDSAIVAAYRRAGLVIFGKTNTPELGIEPVTEPELHGPTYNPWDLTRTPGGSSGGSAAAVAAGLVPAAHASDAGGSLRIPAACCGLFGLKPSRGRVSHAPYDNDFGGLAAQHALTRSVRDSAALLDAVCTPELGDPHWAPPPERPFAAEVGRDPGRLKVAFTGEAIESDAIDPECALAVADAARLMASLGHAVEEVRLPGDAGEAVAAAGIVFGAHLAADLDAEAERRGRPIAEAELEALSFARYQYGRRPSAADYVRALRVVHAYGRTVAALFSRFDVLLTSTLGSPAIPAGALAGVAPGPAGHARRAFMPNTRVFNLTGQPAMSVPLAWSDGGLPIGIQFVGRMADEATLFRLAGQLEQARPWTDRRPMGFG